MAPFDSRWQSPAADAIFSDMTDQARKKRPRDANQLAKLVVDIATGETPDRAPTPEEEGKDPAAVALGKRGGKKGGAARSHRKRRPSAGPKSNDPLSRRW